MTRIRLPYIQHWTDQHGSPRYYFRKAGLKRVPLPGIPGSTEFMEAYQKALQNAVPSDTIRSKAGSISAIVEAYYSSPAFGRMAISTRNNHRNIAERFREKHGDKQLATLRREHIRALIHNLEEKPAKANQLLNVIRHLMQLAVSKGWRGDDPTEGLRKIRYREQEIHTWTPSEMAAFERHWPIGTRAHLAYALMLYTAQRKSDAVKMGPCDIDENTVHVVQQKTRMELWIPLHPELKRVLENSEIGRQTFLVTAYGNPMTVAGFSNWFRECVADANLPKRCTPHGLRKAACVRLAEIGCTPHQIMAISGHKTLAEVERYTSKFDKRRLGENTMKMWASAGKVKE